MFCSWKAIVNMCTHTSYTDNKLQSGGTFQLDIYTLMRIKYLETDFSIKDLLYFLSTINKFFTGIFLLVSLQLVSASVFTCSYGFMCLWQGKNIYLNYTVNCHMFMQLAEA